MHKLRVCVKIPVFFIFLLAAAMVTGCQDDPILTDIEDGVPVITPKSKASITLIQLNSFPVTDPGGNTWDIADPANFDTLGSADVYFNITIPEPQPPVLWSQNSHFLNVTETDTVPYFLLTPYEVVPFGSSIDINIYDYELPDSTLMGTVNFVIGPFPDPLNPYPSYVTTEQNGFSMTIGILWEE
jgi:hypothetical protein